VSGLHRYTWLTFSRELVLLLIAALWWVPFYFLVIASLKPEAESYSTTASDLPSRLAWENLSHAWGGTGGYTLGESMKNSLIITVGTVLILVVVGSLAAYAISRHPGTLGTLLYFVFALAIIIPFQLGIIPTYVALHRLHLNATYAGMILLHTGLLMPLSVFLYAGFVRTIPRDYEEAARVDGAGIVRDRHFGGGEVDIEIVAGQVTEALLRALPLLLYQLNQYFVVDNDRFDSQFRLKLDLVERLGVGRVRNGDRYLVAALR